MSAESLLSAVIMSAESLLSSESHYCVQRVITECRESLLSAESHY